MDPELEVRRGSGAGAGDAALESTTVEAPPQRTGCADAEDEAMLKPR